MSVDFSELAAQLHVGEDKKTAERLLQLMFQVSLLKYEGIHVKCSIAWCDSEPDVQFEKRIPLTLSNLRDVAAAVPGAWQAIAVKGDVELTGILDLRRPWTTQHNGYPVRDRFAHTQRPLVRFDVRLLIKIIGPGVMELVLGRPGDNYQRRMLWRGGELLKQRDIIQAHDFALAFGFHHSQGQRPLDIKSTVEFDRRRQAYGRGTTVRAIVQRMLDGGHGGSLVVVAGQECPTCIEIGVRTAGNQLASASANRVEKLPHPLDGFEIPTDEVVSAELAWMRAIDVVSGLTQHDGAVVLGADLRLFGYGARLSVEIPADRQEIHLIDWYQFDSSVIPIVRNTHERRAAVQRQDISVFLHDKGLRHTSAIATCLSNPKMMIIVVSQDGSVTVVSSLRGRFVRVYTGCGLQNLMNESDLDVANLNH